MEAHLKFVSGCVAFWVLDDDDNGRLERVCILVVKAVTDGVWRLNFVPSVKEQIKDNACMTLVGLFVGWLWFPRRRKW